MVIDPLKQDINPVIYGFLLLDGLRLGEDGADSCSALAVKLKGNRSKNWAAVSKAGIPWLPTQL